MTADKLIVKLVAALKAVTLHADPWAIDGPSEQVAEALAAAAEYAEAKADERLTALCQKLDVAGARLAVDFAKLDAVIANAAPIWTAEEIEDVERASAMFAPLFSTAPETVCSVCNDTHLMSVGERQAPCTRCPVPCEKCRVRGAYCETPRCACACHASSAAADGEGGAT